MLTVAQILKEVRLCFAVFHGKLSMRRECCRWDYYVYFRDVSKRWDNNLSRVTRLEYDFVPRVAESEFYLQQANV